MYSQHSCLHFHHGCYLRDNILIDNPIVAFKRTKEDASIVPSKEEARSASPSHLNLRKRNLVFSFFFPFLYIFSSYSFLFLFFGSSSTLLTGATYLLMDLSLFVTSLHANSSLPRRNPCITEIDQTMFLWKMFAKCIFNMTLFHYHYKYNC